jgi:Protein of unknown function (DUF1064)
MIPYKRLTDTQKESIKCFYEKGFLKGSGQFDEFCKSLKKHPATISLIAKKMGLSCRTRESCEEQKAKVGKERKEWISKNGHPRGMLGKKHSPEYCEVLRERHKNSWKNLTDEGKVARLKKSFTTRLASQGTLSPFLEGKPVTWKQGWRVISGKRIFFRSRWEANYGRYLEFLKEKGEIKEWLHEPQTFWFPKIKRGTLTYLPDFKVVRNDDSHYWVEVKGYLDPRSVTKMKRFKKYFPKEELLLIDKTWYNTNRKNLSVIIKEWEIEERYRS